MKNSFNLYDFENYLIVEFFVRNTLKQIKEHFDIRLQYDLDFAKRYEKWKQISGQNSWLSLYEKLDDNEENIQAKSKK